MKQKSQFDDQPTWIKFHKDGSQFISIPIPDGKRSKNPSWISKLDGEGFQLIAAHRVTKQINQQYGDSLKGNDLLKLIKAVFPASTRKRKLDVSEDVLNVLSSVGMRVCLKLTRGENSLDEINARFIDNVALLNAIVDSPKSKDAFTIGISFLLLILRNQYDAVARRKFGTRKLTGQEIKWTVGTVLRDLGRSLRKEHVEQPKGRANIELLELLKVIRDHEIKKLKPGELRQILQYAGVRVPEGDALRIFEWRAKKKGQL